MPPADTNDADATTLALHALVWTLDDPRRASRLIDVTGIDPQDLRASAGDRATLAAVLGFLEGYEPDLVACAGEIGVTPEALVKAHRTLGGQA